MTEAEWMGCTDPRRMLRFVLRKASDRKLRLFACACCRWGWEWLEGDTARRAVEVAERFADGLTTAEELAVIWDTFLGGTDRSPRGAINWASSVACAEASSAAWCLCGCAGSAAQASVSRRAVEEARRQGISGKAVGRMARLAVRGVQDTAATAERTFLRDIIGNPFRPVAPNSTWFAPAVLSLAQAAYEHRDLPSGHLDPDRLAVLADALEDAGCANGDTLTHLRSPGPHARGCWAVDLLLGRG